MPMIFKSSVDNDTGSKLKENLELWREKKSEKPIINEFQTRRDAKIFVFQNRKNLNIFKRSDLNLNEAN